MSVFEGEVLNQTVGVALKHQIEPEALLAVVEVESAGKSLEKDGKTPCLLFERHVFYRELKKAQKTDALDKAVAQGLANASWQPKTQYKDQGSSANRLTLFSRASVIDQECAARSCSWGVGQTMGFLAEELKFPNAQTMLAYMVKGGVPAQVDCMVREIENKKLTAKLNAHNWAGFALTYNGPGYKQNSYDSKMATAWSNWKKRGVGAAHVTPPKPVDAPPSTQPSGPIKPPSPVTPGNIGKGGGGLLAGLAALWAAIHNNIETQYIIFGGFIIVLLIATGIILWRRHEQNQIPQLGNLASVRTE